MRRERSDEEEELIVQDLRGKVKIPTLRKKPKKKKDVEDERDLLELGVALNQELSQRDFDREAMGDHWLSYYRWLWLGFEQFLLGGVLLIPLSLIPDNDFVIATIALILATAIVIYFGALNGEEKTRIAVRRFGKHVSFLDPGFQMIVPIIETYKVISLANMVWAANKASEKGDKATQEFHLTGATGDEFNPEPGVINVFLRAYGMKITLAIVVRVRRESPADWYRFAYEFANLHEVGQTIASIAQAVVTNMVREVMGDDEITKQSGDIKSAMEARLMGFINDVPEITGGILLALYELARERLGGMLIVSVAITSVQPSNDFTQQLIKLDTAQVDREASRIDGQGTGERWREMMGIVAKLCEDHDPSLVLQTIDRDVRLEVARRENGADQVFNALLMPLVDKLGKSEKPEKPKK